LNVKLAYEAPIAQNVVVDQKWWHRSIAKLEALVKIIPFSWLCLHDRILPREYYRLKGGVGSSLCIVCLKDEETTKHLFVHVEVTRCISKEVCAQLRINGNWDLLTLNEYL